jgi:hypothetical protein
MGKSNFLETALIVAAGLTTSCAEKDSLQIIQNSISEADSFPRISVIVKNYCPEANQEFQDFIFRNHSVIYEEGELRIATARDGLSDLKKIRLGYNYKRKDSLRDGYSDVIAYLGGFSKEQRLKFPNCTKLETDPDTGAVREVTILDDTDEDGLTDCEERLLKTDLTSWDTDNDGLSDYLALITGLNPVDGSQKNYNITPDVSSGTMTLTIGDKVKAGINIYESFNGSARAAAYRYEIKPSTDEWSKCQDLVVSNVPIVPVANGNLLKFYISVEESSIDGSGLPVISPKLITKSRIVGGFVTDGDSMEFDYHDFQ